MSREPMKRMMNRDEFEAWDRGKPVPKRRAVAPPEPEPPKVKNLLTMDKINMGDISKVITGRRNVIRNDEGTRFMGFYVALEMAPDESGKVKNVDGWMPEADYNTFRRNLFIDGDVNVDSMEF